MSDNKDQDNGEGRGGSVFGIGGDADGNVHMMIGITEKGWGDMQEGLTLTFDLTKIGLPIRLILFGTKDQETGYKAITEGALLSDIPVIDMRGKDFSIDEKGIPIKPGSKKDIN